MKQKHNKHEIKWCTEVKIRTQKLDGKKTECDSSNSTGEETVFHWKMNGLLESSIKAY